MIQNEWIMDHLLKIEDVKKSFDGLSVLKDVSFIMRQGEILGLIGPNGAGKTTLFNIISGFHGADKGQIFFKGHLVSDVSPHVICRLGLARTFQLTRPFKRLTVMQNVLVGAYGSNEGLDKAHDVAEHSLKLVSLWEKASHPVSSLTLYERKRLELARALATDPSLLLLDEVMAGLNPSETQTMIDLLRRIRDSEISIFMVEHVMKAIMSLSDRILVLNYGELIFIGPPSEAAKNRQVISAYLGDEMYVE